MKYKDTPENAFVIVSVCSIIYILLLVELCTYIDKLKGL